MLRIYFKKYLREIKIKNLKSPKVRKKNGVFRTENRSAHLRRRLFRGVRQGRIRPHCANRNAGYLRRCGRHRTRNGKIKKSRRTSPAAFRG
jgi:hypothetical protein